MNATLQLDRRVERAGQALAYLLLNIPIAILGALGVLVLVIGAAFSINAIGLPILLGAAAVCRRLVRLDRRAANGLLGTQVPPLPAGVRGSGDPWHRSLEVLSNGWAHPQQLRADQVAREVAILREQVRQRVRRALV